MLGLLWEETGESMIRRLWKLYLRIRESGSNTGLCACTRASTPQPGRRWRWDDDNNMVRLTVRPTHFKDEVCVVSANLFIDCLAWDWTEKEGLAPPNTQESLDIEHFFFFLKGVLLLVDLLHRFGISVHRWPCNGCIHRAITPLLTYLDVQEGRSSTSAICARHRCDNHS